MKTKRKSIKGFTLIELIVTIAVLGTLVLLAAPKFSGHIQDAELTRGFSDAKSIQKASELYFMDNEDWPRLTNEPYTSEEIKTYSEHIYDTTGKEVQLDPNGNYYNIDYNKLSAYVKSPENKENYILQNPVGKVFYMENMTEEGQNRVDYSKQSEPELPILTEPMNFAYTGNVQEVTLSAGKYELEVWGSQGGDAGNHSYFAAAGLGGRGGYSKGTIEVSDEEVMSVYVGGQGTSTIGQDMRDRKSYKALGGFNGGGDGILFGMTGGGGATDIRVSGKELLNRIIVSGGGGGAGNSRNATELSSGGVGGGLIGGRANDSSLQFDKRNGGSGGSQSTGGTGYSTGRFGIGANTKDNLSGGGGGGYYGGGAGENSTGGGGGSSYIDGVQNGQTIAGNQSMPNKNGGTMIGNSGNGFARITQIER